VDIEDGCRPGVVADQSRAFGRWRAAQSWTRRRRESSMMGSRSGLASGEDGR
jgi:hypothetical protein